MVKPVHSSVAPTPAQSAGDAVKVLVVDDSAVIRGLVTRWLDADPGIEVIGSAGNGDLALKSARRVKPDVVVLDIEMPVMDGLTALPQFFEIDPEIKVVISSTLTQRNAEISLKALAAGAADYIAKPESGRDLQASDTFRGDLIEKVRALGRARKNQPKARKGPIAEAARPAVRPGAEKDGLYGSQPIALRGISPQRPAVLAIGSSTGGPQALLKMLAELPRPVEVPILITQHMPATFTRILAQHITRVAKLECREAVDGETLQAGRVYLAPGNFHMVVERRGTGAVISLNQDRPECFCRPSVDPLFRSVARVWGPEALCVVLTGMGHDGLAGAQTVADAGGTILAQDEASSVVWGMPGAVATGGLCGAVLPLDRIAASVGRVLAGGKP